MRTGDLNVCHIRFFHTSSFRLVLVFLFFWLNVGEEDFSVKISDQGGGIPRSEMSKIWTYAYTTAQSQWPLCYLRSFFAPPPLPLPFPFPCLPLCLLPSLSLQSHPFRFRLDQGSNTSPDSVASSLGGSDSGRRSAGAPMAGFGHGLPLSRLYARYFGGDLQLFSMQGYGTDA